MSRYYGLEWQFWGKNHPL